MPAIFPVILPILGTLAGGAAGIGGLVSALSSPGGPSSGDAAKQAREAQQKQAAADAAAKQKAILAALPGAQEQSGGFLNAPSLTDLGAVIAGFPGEATTASGKGALSAFLGTPATGTGATGTGTGNETMVGATYGLSGSQG